MRWSRRRPAWLTAGAVLLSGAGIVVCAVGLPPAQPQGHGREPAGHPVHATDGRGGRTPSPHRGADRFGGALPARDTTGAEHTSAAGRNRAGITALVVGTPKASGAAGSVTVVPGGPDGPAVASKVTLTQDSPGVPGSAEPGDGFGAATAWVT